MLLYGSILTQRGEYQKAEAFLRGAAEQSPDSAIAHGILALMYSLFQQDKEFQTECALAETLSQKEGKNNLFPIHSSKQKLLDQCTLK